MIMGEMVVDKLTQKVSNMLDEIAEINILIRRLTPTQETLNRINERVDAVLGVLKQLERGVQLDEEKLRQLEEQNGLLKEGLEAIKGKVEGLVQAFKQNGEGLNASVRSLQVKGDQFEESIKSLKNTHDILSNRLSHFDFVEEGRWKKNDELLAGLQGKLVEIKVTGIVMIAILLLVLSLQLFR